MLPLSLLIKKGIQILKTILVIKKQQKRLGTMKVRSYQKLKKVIYFQLRWHQMNCSVFLIIMKLLQANYLLPLIRHQRMKAERIIFFVDLAVSNDGLKMLRIFFIENYVHTNPILKINQNTPQISHGNQLQRGLRRPVKLLLRKNKCHRDFLLNALVFQY